MKEGVTINHYGESHFYDGATQYGDVNITNPTYNKYYSSEEKENEVKDEEVPVAPTLIKYIFDDEKRAKVATALKTCTDAKSLTITLERLNEEKIFKLSQMIDASFRESIMPLLGFKTSDEAIRKIIERANIV